MQDTKDYRDYRQAQFDKIAGKSFNPPLIKITTNKKQTHYMGLTPEKFEAIKTLLTK